MNKFFLILIFILNFSKQVFSEEKNLMIQGSKDLPLELNLIIESLQFSTDEKQPRVLDDLELSSIYHIDSYATVLSREDIFLISKIEIYKTLLKTNSNYPKPMIDSDSVKTLKNFIKLSTDPFITWFLNALLEDSQQILTNANYNDYLLQKDLGKSERVEFKKINKKIKLIYRWISIIKQDPTNFQEILKKELIPLMNESLKNIEESFFLMASNTLFQSLPLIIKSTSEFKFFKEVKATKKITTASKKEKTVEDILAPITNENATEVPPLPKPIQDDWLDNELAPNNLNNLPKPSDDTDWLQDF